VQRGQERRWDADALEHGGIKVQDQVGNGDGGGRWLSRRAWHALAGTMSVLVVGGIIAVVIATLPRGCGGGVFSPAVCPLPPGTAFEGVITTTQKNLDTGGGIGVSARLSQLDEHL
jgi:hypothetical protein